MRRIGLAVFVAAGIFLEPLAAGAQQARQGARVSRVGSILSNHPAVPDKDVWSIQAFLEGLATIRRSALCLAKILGVKVSKLVDR